ncbi:MAG TPA: ABC transporter permease [Pirellulales bacterium]|jgi:peptide/nickel transport system permease protein
MSTVPPIPPLADEDERPVFAKSRGFWGEAWLRFRRRKLAMTALFFVGFLSLVGLFAPAIVGTKPLICKYKGKLYFPALGYFVSSWENPYIRTEVRLIYPQLLQKKDPDSWAIYPLIYQDPFRRVQDNEWGSQPGNPFGAQGSPDRHNYFGTTDNGFDVFAIMVHATRTAMLVGFVSMGIAGFIGIMLGSLAGYFRGPVDSVISRIIEVVLCIPTLVLILALMSVLEKPTIWHTMAIIGCTRWTGIARLARAEFFKLRESEFVMSARALGVRSGRIIFRHILPNALAPILVPITFGIADAILIESALSYLGFGPPPPNPSWGDLLSQGRANMQMWWLILFPGLAIFLTVLAYNLIGEGLQEATDPRLREAAK